MSPSSQAGAAFGGDSSPGTAACLSHSPSSPSPGWMCHLGAGDEVHAQPAVSHCWPRTLPASHPSDACTQKPPCSPRAPCHSGCSQQKVPVLSPKTSQPTWLSAEGQEAVEELHQQALRRLQEMCWPALTPLHLPLLALCPSQLLTHHAADSSVPPASTVRSGLLLDVPEVPTPPRDGVTLFRHPERGPHLRAPGHLSPGSAAGCRRSGTGTRSCRLEFHLPRGPRACGAL